MRRVAPFAWMQSFSRDGCFLVGICRSLAYECQRESPLDRVLGRAQRIVDRLGGEPYLLQGLPPRPKGMHLKTYEKFARKLRPIERSLRLEAVNRFGPGFGDISDY